MCFRMRKLCNGLCTMCVGVSILRNCLLYNAHFVVVVVVVAQVTLDVKPFAAHELTVRTTSNQEIVIEGKHDKTNGRHSHVQRQFVRRYQLPGMRDYLLHLI